MKARVSKNLTGTLVLGSLSSKSMVANQEFEITKDQYWAADVQSALKKGWIVCNTKLRKGKTVTVRNISLGSVSIPGVGVLRSGKSAEMDVVHEKTMEIQRLVDQKKIQVGTVKSRNSKSPKDGEFHVHEPSDRVGPDEEPSLSVEKKLGAVTKTKKTLKKAKTIVKKHTPGDDDDLLIDTSAPDIDPAKDADGITWVDADETARRIAAHPILSKKLGKQTK